MGLREWDFIQDGHRGEQDEPAEGDHTHDKYGAEADGWDVLPERTGPLLGQEFLNKAQLLAKKSVTRFATVLCYLPWSYHKPAVLLSVYHPLEGTVGPVRLCRDKIVGLFEKQSSLFVEHFGLQHVVIVRIPELGSRDLGELTKRLVLEYQRIFF